MAPQTQVSATDTPKRAPRRAANGRGRQAKRTSRSTARRRSADIGELESIIRGLEQRISELTDGRNIRSAIAGATGQMSRVVSNASDHVGDMVADTLTDVAQRFQNGATSVTSVAKVGTGAIQRIGSEMERRPFMTVAVALGIGFLAGMAGRRDATS